MSFFVNESLIVMIYLKFRIQQYITCQGFFAGKGLNTRMKVQKYAIFTRKNYVTLNITKVKYHKFSGNVFHGSKQNSDCF